MKRKKLHLPSIARSTIGSLGAALAWQVTLLVSGVLAARLLGPENRGHLALLALIAGIISQIGLLGVKDAVTYYIAREPRAAAGIVRSMTVPAIGQVAGCSLIHVVVLWFLVRDESGAVQKAGLLTLVVTPASLLLNYALSVLQGLQRFRSFNVLRILQPFLYSLVLPLVFVVDTGRLPIISGIWSCAFVVAAITATVVMVRSVPWTSKEAPVASRSEIVRFGVKGFLGSVSPLEAFRLDQAVVGLFLSPAALGIYVASVAFTNLPRFVAQSIGVVAFPHIASQRDKVRARRSMWRFFWLTVASSLAIALPLIVAAPRLVPLILGDAFRTAVEPAQILLAGSVAFGARRILGEGMRGLGYPAANTIAEIASWVWLLPTFAILVPRMELEGVAIALSSASVVSLAVLAVMTTALSRADAESPEATRAAPASVRPRASEAFRDLPTFRRLGATSLPLVVIAGSIIAVIAAGAGLVIPTLTVTRATLLVGLLCLVFAAGVILAFSGMSGVATIALYGAAAFMPLNAFRLSTSVAVSDLFLLIAASSLVFGFSYQFHDRIDRYRPLLLGTAIIFLGGYLGSLYSGDAAQSLNQLVRFAIASSLVPLIVAIWAPDVKQLRVITWIWVLSASANAFAAFLGVNVHAVNHRPYAFTLHPNHIALSAILAVGPAIMLAVSSPGFSRIAALGSCAALSAGIVASGSRAGVLGLAAVAVALCALSGRIKLAGLVACGLIATAVALRSGLIPASPSSALGRLSASGAENAAASNAIRLTALRDALAQALDHPFTGSGFQSVLAANNVYLQLWLSAGVLGLVGMALVIWGVLHLPIAGIRNHTLPPTSRTGAIVVGFSASYIGFLVADFFQGALWERYMWLPPALAVAWAVQVWPVSEQKQEHPIEEPVPRLSLPPTPRRRFALTRPAMVPGSHEV